MKAFLTMVGMMTLTAAHADSLTSLRNEIKKEGYILYQTPLEYAGTGTLVGGSPKTLNVVSSPDTCFQEPTQGQMLLRHVDDAALGSTQTTVTFSANASVNLVNFLGNSNSVFNAGSGFSAVDTIEFSTQGVHVEYLDSVALENYYNTEMSAACKAFLDEVGFIVQALRVDQMTFAFKGKDGAYLNLNATGINKILNISADAKYTIENDYLLTFTTPKYLGYQLGQLRKSDHGMSLYRASQTRGNHFLFKSLSVFPTSTQDSSQP